MKTEDLKDLKHLAALLDLCRAKGVRSYACGGLSFEFFPPEAPEQVAFVPQPQKLKGEPENCRCGHPHHAHGDGGLCIQGCEPQACLAPAVLDDLQREEKEAEERAAAALAAEAEEPKE